MFERQTNAQVLNQCGSPGTQHPVDLLIAKEKPFGHSPKAPSSLWTYTLGLGILLNVCDPALEIFLESFQLKSKVTNHRHYSMGKIY